MLEASSRARAAQRPAAQALLQARRRAAAPGRARARHRTMRRPAARSSPRTRARSWSQSGSTASSTIEVDEDARRRRAPAAGSPPDMREGRPRAPPSRGAHRSASLLVALPAAPASPTTRRCACATAAAPARSGARTHSVARETHARRHVQRDRGIARFEYRLRPRRPRRSCCASRRGCVSQETAAGVRARSISRRSCSAPSIDARGACATPHFVDRRRVAASGARAWRRIRSSTGACCDQVGLGLARRGVLVSRAARSARCPPGDTFDVERGASDRRDRSRA